MVRLFRDSKVPSALKTASGALLVTHTVNPGCHMYGCVIHSPSEGHMSDWPLNWREDRALMERICEHGVGHPDYDQASYNIRIGCEYDNVHGCDGCCSEPA